MSANPFMMGSPMSMFSPPPPFMSMPPPSVFSTPNVDLSTLSVEELQQMEGQERENVEARVRLLRNVHSLLDTVIIQLNQYSQVITALNAVVPSATNVPSTQNLTTSTINSTTTTSSEVANKTVNTQLSSGQTPVPNNSTNDTEQAVAGPSRSKDIVEEVTMTTDTDTALNANGNVDSQNENELRRRRLEKFQNLQKEKEEKGDDNSNE